MSDRVGVWRDKPDKFCMGLLTTFAPSEPHEFCIAGAGKCRILRAQALRDYLVTLLGVLSPFLPLRSATIAIAWPNPRPKSALSQATTAPAFTPGLNLPPTAKPLSVASLRKSAGLLLVFDCMLSR
jgi:hypothetical protein